MVPVGTRGGSLPESCVAHPLLAGTEETYFFTEGPFRALYCPPSGVVGAGRAAIGRGPVATRRRPRHPCRSRVRCSWRAPSARYAAQSDSPPGGPSDPFCMTLRRSDTKGVSAYSHSGPPPLPLSQLALPKGCFSLREREWLQGAGIVPAEFFCCPPPATAFAAASGFVVRPAGGGGACPLVALNAAFCRAFLPPRLLPPAHRRASGVVVLSPHSTGGGEERRGKKRAPLLPFIRNLC